MLVKGPGVKTPVEDRVCLASAEAEQTSILAIRSLKGPSLRVRGL